MKKFKYTNYLKLFIILMNSSILLKKLEPIILESFLTCTLVTKKKKKFTLALVIVIIIMTFSIGVIDLKINLTLFGICD